MRINLKKVLSGVAALAVAASVGPFVSTPLASAAAPGTPPNGSLSMTPNSGDSQQDFVLDPDDPQICPGDGATDGYRWQTFFVDGANDPATLTYTSTGPSTTGTTGWVSALYDTNGNPVVNENPDIGTANISGIPVMDFSVFGPGVVPAGEYLIGIACTLNNVTETFWQLPITISTNGGDGASNIDYVQGWAPGAPTITGVVADTGECEVSFTPDADNPGDSFRVEASLDGAATWTEGIPGTGTSSPLSVTGLTNGTDYDVRVVAVTAAGETESTNIADCVPETNGGAVQNLAVLGQGEDDGAGATFVDVDWDPPAAVAGCTVNGYDVTSSPAGGPAVQPSPAGDATSARVTGVPTNTTITVTVTPTFDPGCVGTPASVQAFIATGNVVIQSIDVTRPIGALVLTQVCGSNGALPAEGQDAAAGATFGSADGQFDVNDPGTLDGYVLSTAPLGFDRAGALPAIPAKNTSAVGAPFHQLGIGAAPRLAEDPAGGTPTDQTSVDPRYVDGEYPYPTDANGVPDPAGTTYCGIQLGVAEFVTEGSGAGQFFAAQAAMSQVTIVDTRNVDQGWTLTGTMSDFVADPTVDDGGGVDGPTDSFSGDFLGWTPVVTEDTSAFDSDADGVDDYDQQVIPGAPVEPGQNVGLSGETALDDDGGETIARAEPGEGLGTAIIDARLKLLIPVTADAGLYEGDLRFSAA